MYDSCQANSDQNGNTAVFLLTTGAMLLLLLQQVLHHFNYSILVISSFKTAQESWRMKAILNIGKSRYEKNEGHTNACNRITPFTNGKHLLYCHDFQCDEKYYKCHGYYCIPLRNVCNMMWDCPRGLDEEDCSERQSCPGLFREFIKQLQLIGQAESPVNISSSPSLQSIMSSSTFT